MPLEYLIDGITHLLSYKELKEQYTLFTEMTDEEFIQQLPKAIHLACIICFLKEIPTYVCLSDRGVVHQLAHLQDIPEHTNLSFVRELFNQQLLLA